MSDDANVRERFLAALRASGAGAWLWDVLRDRVDWDEALCAVYRVDPEGAPTTVSEFLSFVHREDRARVGETIKAALAAGGELEYEFRIVTGDGEIRWLYDRSQVVRGADGRPVSVIGACIDVTERKRSEQALLDSRTRLELATLAADIGIWDWDLVSNEILYSERAKAIYGFEPSAPVTFEQVRSATHPDDLPRTSAMAARARDPLLRERIPYEYRIIRPDGRIRWVLAHGQAVFEEAEGAPTAVRYVGTLQDVTARHETEAALRASESRLRLAIAAGRMAVWEYDVAAERVTSSPEFNRLLGYPEDAILTPDELATGYPPGERERLRRAGQAALARGERFFEIEYRYTRKDGRVRWFLLRAEIQGDPAHRPDRVIGVLLDVTERKEALERQRLLTNELNHRVKNTLAMVQAIATQTLRHASDLKQAEADVEGRIKSLARAHDILSEQDWRRARVEHLIRDAVEAFSIDSSRVRAKGPDLWLPSRNSVDLAVVLHELLTNAVKYGALSTDRGTISIDWSSERRDGAEMFLFHWRESGGPPSRPPERSGFGTRLIHRIAAHCGGETSMAFEPGGLKCELRLSVSDPAGSDPEG